MNKIVFFFETIETDMYAIIIVHQYDYWSFINHSQGLTREFLGFTRDLAHHARIDKFRSGGFSFIPGVVSAWA